MASPVVYIVTCQSSSGTAYVTARAAQSLLPLDARQFNTPDEAKEWATHLARENPGYEFLAASLSILDGTEAMLRDMERALAEGPAVAAAVEVPTRGRAA